MNKVKLYKNTSMWDTVTDGIEHYIVDNLPKNRTSKFFNRFIDGKVYGIEIIKRTGDYRD